MTHFLPPDGGRVALCEDDDDIRFYVKEPAGVVATTPEPFDREQYEAELRKTKLIPPAQTIGRMQRFELVAAEIVSGLDGKPFSWRAVDFQHARPILQAMGIHLVSKSRAKRLGFVLKRGAQPVGQNYYTAPISKMVNVYVLECQFNRASEATDERQAEIQL